MPEGVWFSAHSQSLDSTEDDPNLREEIAPPFRYPSYFLKAKPSISRFHDTTVDILSTPTRPYGGVYHTYTLGNTRVPD